MSFDTWKVGELKAIAEEFAVDTAGLKNKQDVIAALAEEGVTYAVYAKTLKDLEDAKELNCNSGDVTLADQVLNVEVFSNE